MIDKDSIDGRALHLVTHLYKIKLECANHTKLCHRMESYLVASFNRIELLSIPPFVRFLYTLLPTQGRHAAAARTVA